MPKVNVDVSHIHVEAVWHPKAKVNELQRRHYPHPLYLYNAQRAARKEDTDLVAEVEDDECIVQDKAIFLLRI